MAVQSTEPVKTPVVLTAKVGVSYQAATRVTGIGIVLQSTNRARRAGPILDEIAEAYEGVPPGVSELFAVFRALEIAGERGYQRVKGGKWRIHRDDVDAWLRGEEAPAPAGMTRRSA